MFVYFRVDTDHMFGQGAALRQWLTPAAPRQGVACQWLTSCPSPFAKELHGVSVSLQLPLANELRGVSGSLAVHRHGAAWRQWLTPAVPRQGAA